MRILLTNDDGYKARGIRRLKEVLSSHGHDCLILAPETEQSACSRRISNARNAVEAESGIWYVEGGTPADCIRALFVSHAVDFEPEVVISGVNNGLNASLDLVYSGTASAAAEAVCCGVRAIAVSAYSGDTDAIETACAFIASRLESLVEASVPGRYININVPQGANCSNWAVARAVGLFFRGPQDFSDSALLSHPASSESDTRLLSKHVITLSSILASQYTDEAGNIKLQKELAYECRT